jgi:hypothetical protein
VGGEVVIYELDAHRGHCLNRTAALVWRACDGRRSVAEIAAELGRELRLPADVELVRYALRKLRDARLLDWAGETASLTRRELALRVGRVALLPAVASLVAPRPAQAATCAASCVCNCAGQGNFTSCSTDGLNCDGSFCCNGVCVPPSSVCT